MSRFEPFDAVVECAVRLLGLSMARLRLFDSRQRLRVMAYAGRVVKAEDWRIVPLGEGFAGKVAAGSEPVWVPNVRADERVRDIPWVREEELESLAGLPLFAAGRRLGMMAVGSREPRAFAAEERELMQSYAAMAAWKVLPHQHLVEQGRFDAAR